jgi:2'-hydroxyisoflavone reductase
MKLLVLGGTIFFGRRLVEAALAAGHEVTLFNRGQHNPDHFPGAEKLHGDRDGGLDVLRGRRWDAVVDTCGYVPRVVRASAELLAGSAEHYTFISSISAYAGNGTPGEDESAPLATLNDPTTEEATNAAYGGLKALCEQVVQEVFSGRSLIVRPGLIVGAGDPSDRFTYWPHRIARGGEVLAPGRPDRQVQFIDARDLSEWTLRMSVSHATGAYNATGPDYALSMGNVLDACREVSDSDARFTWADGAWLVEQGVAPWMELPLYVPESDEFAGFAARNVGKAVAAGLTFRPVAETVRDTLIWDVERWGATGAPQKLNAGLPREREAELLAAWHARG